MSRVREHRHSRGLDIKQRVLGTRATVVAVSMLRSRGIGKRRGRGGKRGELLTRKTAKTRPEQGEAECTSKDKELCSCVFSNL